MSADCNCSSFPHELWCPAAPKGLTLDELIEWLQHARKTLSGEKPVIVDFHGTYRIVSDARGEFHRGQFVVALGVKE